VCRLSCAPDRYPIVLSDYPPRMAAHPDGGNHRPGTLSGREQVRTFRFARTCSNCKIRGRRYLSRLTWHLRPIPRLSWLSSRRAVRRHRCLFVMASHPIPGAWSLAFSPMRSTHSLILFLFISLLRSTSIFMDAIDATDAILPAFHAERALRPSFASLNRSASRAVSPPTVRSLTNTRAPRPESPYGGPSNRSPPTRTVPGGRLPGTR